MLLEVRFGNYQDIRNQISVSMEAEALSDHRDSILTCDSGGGYRVLPVKLLYGPDRTARHSILSGLKLIQRLLSGQGGVKGNTSLPNFRSSGGKSSFGISVLSGGIRYDYDFSMGKSFVVGKEEFRINSTLLYERNEREFHIRKTPKSLSFYDDVLKKHLDLTEKLFMAKRGEFECRLLLPSIFSGFISCNIISPFLKYVAEKILFFDNSNLEQIKTREIRSPYIKKTSGSSLFHDPTSVAGSVFQYCIHNGMCLVIDENLQGFEPLEIIPFIRQLHDKQVNTEAQLLFSSYQPLYMHKKLIRRDEVSFVTDGPRGTNITNLSQFAVREENYIKKYLRGEYIPSYNYSETLSR